MVQDGRRGLPAGPVGGFPCPACHVWIVSPKTWPFSSAVRGPPVWHRPLLNAVGVALKLRTSATSTGSFFQMRFGEAESVPDVRLLLLGGISTRLWFLLLVDVLFVS